MADQEVVPDSQEMEGAPADLNKYLPSDEDDAEDGDKVEEPYQQGENEFIVEDILDSRRVKGKLEYFIKWKNYDKPEDNTWEPEYNCRQCDELIAKFNAMKAKKKQAKRKRSRGSLAPTPTSSKRKRQAVDSEDESRSSVGTSRTESVVKEFPARDETPAPRKSLTPVAVSETSVVGKSVDAVAANIPDEAADFPGVAVDISAVSEVIPDDAMPVVPGTSKPSTSAGKKQDIKKSLNKNPVKLPDDASYRISKGEEVEYVIGVSNVYKDELMAVVKYKSDPHPEAVPTRLLGDLCPKPLLKYYEGKLTFCK